MPDRGCQYESALSPDGSRKAFYRDRNVWLANADGSGEIAIMIDGFAIVWNYVTQPIALRLGALEIVEHIGQLGVYGAVVGLIYQRKAAIPS